MVCLYYHRAHLEILGQEACTVSIHGLRSCTVNDLSIVVLTNRIVFKNWTQVVVVVRTQASAGGVDS